MKTSCIFYLGVLITLFFLQSCGKAGKGTSSKRTFKEQASSVNDSMQYAWMKMIESDDKKIASINRLLEEVSYTSNYNQEELSRLRNQLNTLKNKRYQRNTMTSQQIDNYDIATDSLVRGTINLVNSTPEMENHSITQTLINEIQQEDNNVIIYRIRYDQKAKEYNQFVDRNATKLSKSGSPFTDYKKVPIFELQTVSQ